MAKNPDNQPTPPQPNLPPLPIELFNVGGNQSSPVLPPSNMPPLPTELFNSGIAQSPATPINSCPPLPLSIIQGEIGARPTPTTSTISITSIHNLAKQYSDSTASLMGATLKLYSGQVTYIVDGSNQSSLLWLLTPNNASKVRRLLIRNHDVRQLTFREPEDLQGSIMEYKDQRSLDSVSQTGIVNVACWLHYYEDLSWEKAKEVARNALDEVSMPPDTFGIPMCDLTVSQVIKVVMAKVFACNCKLCLFDDVFATLDLPASLEIIPLFENLAGQNRFIAIITERQELYQYFDGFGRRLTVLNKHNIIER